MANEVVKYNNDLNTASMRGWNTEELNFFFSILAKAKNQGTKRLVFESDELKRLCKYSSRSVERWTNTMISCTKKIAQLTYWEQRNSTFEIMTLFTRLRVESSNGTVEVEVSPYFEYLLNKFEDLGFTTFELEEFISIRSTYAKQMYRQLKQWKKLGYKEWSVQEFRYLLAIPNCYKSSDIDKRVLKPIVKELEPIFNLKVKPIKKKTKGNPIIGYAFKWTPERTNQWIEGQPQRNPNKPKKVAKSIVPNWYDDVESEAPNNELLNEVLMKQSKLKENK